MLLQPSFKFLFLFLTFYRLKLVNGSPLCTVSLWWAPKRLKTVFTTFINHPNCPSWTTRNSFTKSPTGKSEIIIPKSIPFAFICGVCYSSSSLSSRISLFDKGDRRTLISIPFKDEKGHEFKLNDYSDCLLSYGLATPDKPNGKITCELSRGTRSYKEVLNYQTKYVKTSSEEKNIKIQQGQEVTLECPQLSTKDKRNTVYVWHYAKNTTSSILVKPSLDRSINLKPERSTEILCSTYDFINPTLVLRTKFKITVKVKPKERFNKPESSRAREWNINGEEILSKNQNSSPKSKSLKLFTIIGVLITGAVLLILSVLCVSYGVCKCHKRSEEIQIVDPPQTIPNGLHQNVVEKISNSISNQSPLISSHPNLLNDNNYANNNNNFYHRY